MALIQNTAGASVFITLLRLLVTTHNNGIRTGRSILAIGNKEPIRNEQLFMSGTFYMFFINVHFPIHNANYFPGCFVLYGNEVGGIRSGADFLH